METYTSWFVQRNGSLSFIFNAVHQFRKSVQAMDSRLTVLPFSSGWVDDTEQFIVGDSLGIEINGLRLAPLVLVRPVESVPDLTLTSTCAAQQEHGVSHIKQLLQLYNLKSHSKVSEL